MKKALSFQLCSLCLAASMIVGCQVKKPDYVIPESQMENLLYDYHMAQALSDELPYTENYKRVLYAKAVFQKHHTDQAQFDSSLVWYTRNTEVLAKMYERVSVRLRTQRDGINHLVALRDKKPQTTAPGDSVNVWIGEELYLLSGMPLNNKVTFTLPTDSNFKERDTLVWEVRYNFNHTDPDSLLATTMALQLIFENDSILSQTKHILNSGIERISLQSDTLGTVKEINGFIYYTSEQAPRTLLADRISLMRYRCTDTLSVAARDSLRADSIEMARKDSINKKDSVTKIELQAADTIKTQNRPRLRPDELNKVRTRN